MTMTPRLSKISGTNWLLRRFDYKTINPQQHKKLKRRPNQKIYRTPCMAALRNVMNGRIDIGREKEHQHRRRYPTRPPAPSPNKKATASANSMSPVR